MRISQETKISEILIDHLYAVLALEHFGIELPLGEKTIEKLCSENKIPINLFIKIINLFINKDDISDFELSVTEVGKLLEYLRNCHRYYENEKFPQIRNCIEKIIEVNNCPEIMMLEKFFNDYINEVTEHLDYENGVVFPHIIRLIGVISGAHPKDSSFIYSVVEYKEQHNDIEEKLIDLKNLLIKYLPVKGEQIFRRQMLFNLQELENDLKIHQKIEDNILIPMVEKIEKSLRN